MISQSDMKWLWRVSRIHQHGPVDHFQHETLSSLPNARRMVQYRSGDAWYDAPRRAGSVWSSMAIRFQRLSGTWLWGYYWRVLERMEQHG